MKLHTSTNTSEIKARRIELSEAQHTELKNGYRKGEQHCFRMRCPAVRPKSEGLSYAKAGERVGMNEHTVNSWLKRYRKEGAWLETRPGHGRKPVVDCSDEEAVHRAFEQERQSSEGMTAGLGRATPSSCSTTRRTAAATPLRS